MPIKNYLSNLYEIYRAYLVDYWEFIYQFLSHSKIFLKLYSIEF